MKVNFKRVATAALAVAMSLSLNVSAFAAGNGGEHTLTVKGDTLDNKKVYAVQMFDARVTEGANNTFDNYEMVNSEKWMEFFKASAEDGGVGLTDQDKDGDTDADDARAYLEKMTNESTDVKAFADKAQAWVRGHAGNFTVITSDSENPAVADKETFRNLKPGYYLVYPEGGSTGDGNRGTDAMLVNVPTNGNAEWAMKSTFPTVEKTVEDNNDNTNGDGANGSAQVGDIVTFTLTSAVPDMSDYSTSFYFAFNDTLSNGLQVVDSHKTVVEDGDNVTIDNLTVTIGGVPVATGDYTVSLTGNVLKVEFTNLKNVAQANQDEDIGKAIVVTYQAMITEAAVVGAPALNTVKVEYSNDPTTNTKGESTPDESKVYTYQISVHKYTGDWSNGSAPYLPGAKFVLSKSANTPSTSYESDENVIKLVGSDNEYCVATADDVDNTTYEFTTNDAGKIVIKGLEAGTYYLHEIEAPNGYNKLKEPIKITISVSGGNASLEAPVYTIGSTANTANDDTVGVQNKTGIELPETGSIGTIGLTALGVVVVVAGLFAFPRKKKTRQD